ncbi:metal ABC transporter permease [Hydrogenimonas sp.]|uniref:metal ABC transporter permease n=1 Tax=Hydrogenimonas sp. TaxID=2231112 RepID=UPI00262A5BF2|nr:metal ABC transporter permease [Hydrogenimonas sp.]
MSIVEILWPAFVLGLLLVFIHAIFGLEIIRRGVIFTDLAIGQIAAVGIAVSAAFFDGAYQTVLTLGFALLAAVLIAVGTRRVEHVEAFIGLLYALGISSIMLILAQSGEGMELFSKLNAADILFTMPEDVAQASMLYGAIAALMFILYPRLRGFTKELLFFGALAVTVTSSVQIAGVLVVFALLVAPAYAALTQTRLSPLLFAWIFGAASVIVALYLSYRFDLPTGYTIIFTVVVSTMVLILSKSKKLDGRE